MTCVCGVGAAKAADCTETAQGGHGHHLVQEMVRINLPKGTNCLKVLSGPKNHADSNECLLGHGSLCARSEN